MGKNSMAKSVSKSFTWRDGENALLMKVIIDYKAQKMSNRQDWDSIRMTYSDLVELFIVSYASEEGRNQDFPRFETRKDFTKEKLSKKTLKNNFRKAVDSGRRSGGGKVVFSLYDDCYDVWVGCPAAERISNGIETHSVNAISSPSHVAQDSTYEENENSFSIESDTSSSVGLNCDETMESDVREGKI